MKKDKNLDVFYYHEALDRAYITVNFIESVLAEHPVIRKNNKIRKKVNKALWLIRDVYQLVGNLKGNQ